MGIASLNSNTTGSNNVAFGDTALLSNTTASNNTAVGYQAGYSNTTGTVNVFVGRLAGYYSTGSSNTCIGEESGYYTTGSNNTYLGYGAGPQSSGSTGSYNTLLGNLSGYLITTGSKNTVLGCYNGNQGGLDIRTASNYIVLSDGDGNPRAYWDGSGVPTFTGSGLTIGGGTYKIASQGSGVAYMGFITASNALQMSFNSTSAGVSLGSGSTSWSTFSDERMKDIIEPITDAANKVSTLRAVIGKYKTDEDNIRRSFLIAQDVQSVFPEAVDTTNEDALGIRYTEVIPLLVAAIKELKAELDTAKAQIAALQGAAQ